MATNASVILKFSDGTISYLRNAITLDTFTEVKTDASGLVNQAGDISAGQANQGKLLIAAAVKVSTDDATTGLFCAASVVGVSGNIIGLIQGSGAAASGLPMLKRPVRMMTGVKVNVLAQSIGTGVQIGSCAVYCASGKVDIFTGVAIASTDVPLLSVISGSTIGEALVGERVICTYQTYGGTNGVASDGIANGVNAFFVEDAQGQLKAMMYAEYGTGQEMVKFVDQQFNVVQNDTFTLRANIN